MIDKQSVTVNVHHPQVTKVDQLYIDSIVVTLSNGQFHGTVHLFFDSDSELKKFVDDILELHAKAMAGAEK